MPEGTNITGQDPTAGTADDLARAKRDARELAKNGGVAAPEPVNPNGRLYTWGGQYGLANKDANYFRNQAEAAQGRQAVQTNDENFNYDRVNSQYARQGQNQAGALMMARATGATPSIAQMQADRQMQQASAEQASAAASARGPAGLALAQQNAAGNVANMQGQISNSAQINAATERLQAEQAAFGAASNMRQGDFAAQSIDQQNAAQNATFQAQQRGMNDSMTNNMYGNELGVRTNELTAQQNYEAALQAGYFGQAAQTQQQQQIDHQESQDTWNTVVGTAGAVAGYAAFLSDERTKDVGDWADPAALNARAMQGQPPQTSSWLSDYMSGQPSQNDPYGIDAATGERGLGAAGAPKGLAASRANQAGGMFPSSSMTVDQGRGMAPGTSDYDQAFAGSNQRAAQGKSMTDDAEFAAAFSTGKDAATKAISGDASAAPAVSGAPEADAAAKAKAADAAKTSAIQGAISKGVDKMKQQTHPITIQQFQPARYITSDTRAKRDAAFQQGRVAGMMEADKAAGTPFVVDSDPDAQQKDARAQLAADRAKGVPVVIDARSPQVQRAAEAASNVHRSVIRHPLDRAEPESDVVTRTTDRAMGGMENAMAPVAGAMGAASVFPQQAQSGAMGGLASRVRGAAQITSDERAKKPISDKEAERLKGLADGMASSMAATKEATKDVGPATGNLDEKVGGLRAAMSAQDEAARKTGPAAKPSDWFDQSPLANANRSMASSPYTYKPEFTPPDQKPGELNVGPMAQNMAADPVASTAVKKTPQGMLVLDQNKLDRLHSAGLSHLQKKDDEKEDRIRRLESLFGG